MAERKKNSSLSPATSQRFFLTAVKNGKVIDTSMDLLPSAVYDGHTFRLS
jgi:hypothetical protein